MNIVKEYFLLQFAMLQRRFKDFGIDPVFACIIIGTAFFACSFFLFNKSAYAVYGYLLIAGSILLNHNETKRNEFLKFTFSKRDYIGIRIVENVLTILPFIIFLLIKKQFLPALVLPVLAVFIIPINSGSISSVAILTPFYKKPFEFISGFRSTFLAFILAYFVTVMAVVYQNFNLGIFSLLFVFLICLSFYSETEDVSYVWVHNLAVDKFLLDKITTAIVFSTIITLPIVAGLMIFFKTKIIIVFAFQLLGYTYLVTIILAKYAAFPKKINLPQAILLAMGMMLPPILLGVIPFFYVQSQKQLKAILG